MAAATTTPPSTTVRPTTVRRIGTAAAIVGGVALIAKVALAAVTAGAAPSAAFSVLYLVGTTLPLVAAAGIASARRRRSTMIATYAAVVFAHLFYIMTLSEAVEGVVGLFTDKLYLTEEIPLAVLGLIWLIVGLNMRAHDRA